MIHWNDFVFDDVVGFVLAMPDEAEVRAERLGGLSIRSDAGGVENAVMEIMAIQETRREQRPARMAGPSGLDSNAVSSDRKSAGFTEPTLVRQRGEG